MFTNAAGEVIGAIATARAVFHDALGSEENEIIPSLQEGAEVLSMKFGYAPI